MAAAIHGTDIPKAEEAQVAAEPVVVREHPAVDDLLTGATLTFLGRLHERFEPTRRRLLADRVERQAAYDAGERPGFAPETAHIRSGHWHVAPAPADLTNRRTELTGPVRRVAMVEALNSGASVFMADFEDTMTPTWSNCLDGRQNLRDAYAGTLSAEIDGDVQTPDPAGATLVLRTRGLHLDEMNLTVDGDPIAAALFDFGVCVFHNAHAALAAGTGPYFYLPKLEGAGDARLWAEVFVWAEDELGLPRGTIRATVLVETIQAAFEMEEILFELRDHITGLHTGNWDYLFSLAKAFRLDSGYVLPDRDQLSGTTPFIRAFTELLVSTCHRRGAHALGGMSGIIPDPVDPDRTAEGLRKVTVDKRREAGDGFDGTRIAHPALVEVAEAEFDRVLSYRPNQIEFQRDDVYVTAGDLLSMSSTRGQRTEDGLRRAIRIALHYMGQWFAGNGAVAIDDHVEDLAMAELCRTQIWQWRHHAVELTNGVTVDDGLLRRCFDEELDALRRQLGDHAWSEGRYDEAHSVLSDITFTDQLCDYLPLVANPRL